ncbi:hypothetical protein [Melghirimyces algeriensis]|uniref:hypothetical protein n=1 Tax=Melghirimyces algeriensis TaxID=910412 RepID=UPI00115A5CC9|nr:hypothetical protein [Melghirimyces algeriensis]
MTLEESSQQEDTIIPYWISQFLITERDQAALDGAQVVRGNRFQIHPPDHLSSGNCLTYLSPTFANTKKPEFLTIKKLSRIEGFAFHTRWEVGSSPHTRSGE